MNDNFFSSHDLGIYLMTCLFQILDEYSRRKKVAVSIPRDANITEVLERTARGVDLQECLVKIETQAEVRKRQFCNWWQLWHFLVPLSNLFDDLNVHTTLNIN